jgi:hypothetical protein
MPRPAAALLVVLLALATSTACYTAGVVSPARRGVERQTDHGAVLFWGMWQSKTDASECREGLAEAASWTPWYGYIVSPLTLGIVHPVVKGYTCAIREGE